MLPTNTKGKLSFSKNLLLISIWASLLFAIMYLIGINSVSQLFRFPFFQKGPQNNLHHKVSYLLHSFKSDKKFFNDYVSISYRLKTVFVCSTAPCAKSCMFWSKAILLTQESCSLYRYIVKNNDSIFTWLSLK